MYPVNCMPEFLQVLFVYVLLWYQLPRSQCMSECIVGYHRIWPVVAGTQLGKYNCKPIDLYAASNKHCTLTMQVCVLHSLNWRLIVVSVLVVVLRYCYC